MLKYINVKENLFNHIVYFKKISTLITDKSEALTFYITYLVSIIKCVTGVFL